MNLLTDNLPIWDKHGNALKTSFVNWVRFNVIMCDEALSDSEKVSLGLAAVYPDFHTIQDVSSIHERLDGALCFMNGWITSTNKGGQRVIDFEQDALLIYASFYQQYGIDLHKQNDLHWYKFMSLLSSLSQETAFGFIVHIRSCKIEGDKETQKRIRELKRTYQIKQKFSEENSPAEKVKRYTERLKNNITT